MRSHAWDGVGRIGPIANMDMCTFTKADKTLILETYDGVHTEKKDKVVCKNQGIREIQKH